MEHQTGTKLHKTALVTGATSGIGRELANLLAKDGYDLVLIARQEDSLAQVASGFEQQYGVQVTQIAKNLADEQSPQQIYDEVTGKGLHIDVLINNAGMGEYGLFATETDLQKEMDIIRINVSSLVGLTKLFLRDMVQGNEGKILMLGSVASVIPNPLMAVYGATKSFIYSFSEALRNEVKDTDVTITVLMPGATDTDFFNKAGAMNTVAQEKARDTSPADVAKTGYEALMSGKDKVVHGMANKASVAMAHLLPDSAVAKSSRQQMQDRYEAEAESNTSHTVAMSIGIAALALAGLFVLNVLKKHQLPDDVDLVDEAEDRFRNEKMRYKAGCLKNRAMHGLEELKDTVLKAVN